jgi:hypothetical protein
MCTQSCTGLSEEVFSLHVRNMLDVKFKRINTGFLTKLKKTATKTYQPFLLCEICGGDTLPRANVLNGIKDGR